MLRMRRDWWGIIHSSSGHHGVLTNVDVVSNVAAMQRDVLSAETIWRLPSCI
jgi:hypothetical protein